MLWVLIRSASLLMNTHNICFRGEIRKILTWYPLLSRPVKIVFIAMISPQIHMLRVLIRSTLSEHWVPKHTFFRRGRKIVWIPALSRAMKFNFIFFFFLAMFTVRVWTLEDKSVMLVAPAKACFSTKNWYISYFFVKTYLVVLTRSASARHF